MGKGGPKSLKVYAYVIYEWSHSNEANMTGFIVTCEERSYIKNSSSCDMTMKFNVSDFEWPDDPRVLQAKLFEEICLAVRNFVLLLRAI